ncbi:MULTISPECIES: YpmS family protein [Bacillus]|uniref:YpmS family protein n=1 Tax=Bacillus TaxID=1386 RepID=UPI00040C5BC8|nr:MULTISPECIES: YpmS family protein [Bacillus]QHZ47333.1 YpmS family protein [Bacillus sp. NSP9.1]WFA03394.1 YpmS family protein [Bacillus sp. HSf4]
MKKWKRLFFILAAANAIILAGILILLFLPGGQKYPGKTPAPSEYELNVTSTKESLAAFINTYLEKESSPDLDYKIEIDDEFHIVGAIRAFSSTVDAKVSFRPAVEKNGDVVLDVTKFSIGRLNVPISVVLNYMDQFYDLPPFVHVRADAKEIQVRLSEMPLKNGMYIKAKNIDLKQDQIEFVYYQPAASSD